MTEIWRMIDGYDEMYEVSNWGKVRSWHNNKHGRGEEPRTLKPKMHNGCYPIVDLYKNRQRERFFVHGLVLTAFVSSRPSGLECCHGDGNPAHNHLSNLRWDTRSANMQDAITHGTWTPPDLRGEANGRAKLTKSQVIEIRRAYTAGGVLQRELGALFGVGRSTIGDIIRREKWTHVI